VTVGDAIVVDGVPDPELIQKQVLPKLLLLRRRAILCELPLTRDKDAEISAGRWQRRAVGRHCHFIKPTSLFCRSNHPHRLCADMRMSRLASVAPEMSARRAAAGFVVAY